MKLSYIFSQLETSELKQLSCIDPATGKIKAEQYQGIVDVMNQGLVDLHTRFALKIGKVEVPIDPLVSVYDMTAVDPQVRGRFLQLHKVTDEEGRDLQVNAFTDYSLSFRNQFVFEVPEYLRTVHPLVRVNVLYRSLPTKIGDCYGDIDPELVEVELPMAYVWALCLYVASRLHTPVGLTDGTYRVNAFLGLFNAECTRLEEVGMDLDFQRDLGQLQRGGWA
jgi:hypothetical protein